MFSFGQHRRIPRPRQIGPWLDEWAEHIGSAIVLVGLMAFFICGLPKIIPDAPARLCPPTMTVGR